MKSSTNVCFTPGVSRLALSTHTLTAALLSQVPSVFYTLRKQLVLEKGEVKLKLLAPVVKLLSRQSASRGSVPTASAA